MSQAEVASSDAEMTGAAEGYRGPQVCSIVGITYRQLDYWARTDLIRPSIADARGSGTQRRYSYRDLVELKVIKSLLDAGMALQKARGAIEYLRNHLGTDIASASLVLNGSDSVVLAHDSGELVDLVRRGQGVFSIMTLDGVKAELDAAITELRPKADPAVVPGLRDPNAVPGLHGPNAVPGIRGPNAVPGIRRAAGGG